MSQVTISPVRTSKDKLTFIKLLWKIYKGNPYWAPPLIMDRKKLIDTEKNPFYKHAELELFLARKNGEVVGRIGAIINHSHNKFHNENIGFFGFFDSINDQDVANALFDAAKGWLKAKGVTAMRGPTNPSSNDEWGLLIEGFNMRPQILMPYNHEYYISLCENYGLKKAKDLYAYLLTKETTLTDKLTRVAKIAQERTGMTLRTLNMKDFDNEVKRIKQVYNDAWLPNWGFVPLTDEEFDYMAADLRQIVLPDIVLVGEIQGKPVGFALTLPDFNFVLQKIGNGRLFPFGIFKLLKYRKKIDTCRIIALGIVRDHQKRGLDAVFYYYTWKNATERGINTGEASWVLEDNVMMNRGAELMNGLLHKRYRIYEMPL
jgi:hypothetical protein